jgi:hypothetical protein
MIYNLSTILREVYNKNTNTNKKNINVSTHNSFERKNIFKPHYNLKINTELANQKSVELYNKYNTNTNTYRKIRIINLDPLIKSNLDITEMNMNKTISFYIKNGLVVGGFFMLLACFRNYLY